MGLTVFLSILVAGCLYQVIRGIWRQHDAHVKEIKAIHTNAMFDVARQELDTLETIASRPHVQFRARRPHESRWDYARNLADCGHLHIKPWEPTFGRLRMYEERSSHVSFSVKIQMWTANVEGVMHRVGRLPIGDGWAPVFICDPTTRVTTAVEVHDIDASPVITCLGCVTYAKN